MAPLVVTSKVPDTVDAFNAKALASFKVTLLPEVIPTLANKFAASNVMLLADPAAKVAAPVTSNAPLSVIAPLEVTLNAPDTVDAPNTIAPASTNVTSLPVVITTVPKLFAASSNVMLLVEPAAKVATPEADIAALSVIPPDVEVTLSVLNEEAFVANETAPAELKVITEELAAGV